jgi:hypothetical protein
MPQDRFQQVIARAPFARLDRHLDRQPPSVQTRNRIVASAVRNIGR